MSSGHFINLRSDHYVEDDGSHTVMIIVSGLPSLPTAQKISDWIHDLVKEHASDVGHLVPESLQ